MTTVKCFVWIMTYCLVFASIRGEEFPTKELLDLLAPVVLKCEELTGVDRNLVTHFAEGRMPDDPTLKCYMKCIFVEFGVLDVKTGTFHYEKMLDAIPESMKKIAYDMGKDCVHFKGEDGSDLCQVSYDLHKCWQQADPQALQSYAKIIAIDGRHCQGISPCQALCLTLVKSD